MNCSAWEIVGTLAAALAVIIWFATAVIFVNLAWCAWKDKRERRMATKRCKASTSSGHQCDKDAEVFLVHNNAEYPVCFQHYQQGIKSFEAPKVYTPREGEL